MLRNELGRLFYAPRIDWPQPIAKLAQKAAGFRVDIGSVGGQENEGAILSQQPCGTPQYCGLCALDVDLYCGGRW